MRRRRLWIVLAGGAAVPLSVPLPRAAAVSTSTDRSPTHVFTISGTFPVTEAAVNQTCATYSTGLVTVAPPSKANPVAGFPRSRAPRAVTPRR